MNPKIHPQLASSMQRRDFLRATLLTAGGIVAACSSPGTAATPENDGGTTDGSAADASPADLALTAQFFPQSVCSGDPRPDGVILWTRLVDSAAGDKDLPVGLRVSTKADFSQLIELNASAVTQLLAKTKHDHCVKVRLVGLAAGTTYYYQFDNAAQKPVYSHVAQFKTAPAADADVPVKFAVVCCQDFNGKYYNVHARLAKEDLDFFLHLGDYIYETTGDPRFQNIDTKRRAVFSDTKGAISFLTGAKDEFYAAQSLSNYRDLYKIYRGDTDLQKLHERAAMIAVGDDHEFADDCWGPNATYFDGTQDEFEPARRGQADQAWCEYMPIDFAGAPDFEFDPTGKFPDNLKAYRDFAFGKHAHIVMTDLRRYRSDHLIAEDAAPGAIALLEEELKAAVGGALPAFAVGYFELDKDLGGDYGKALRLHAKDLEGDEKRLVGLYSSAWVNAALDKLTKAKITALPPTITPEQIAKMPKGMAYHQLFKNAWNTSLGSRYLVLAETFRIYARARWQKDKNSQHAMGDAQEKWFVDTLKASTKTWKLWGNEYTVQHRAIDLAGLPLPDNFKQKFLLSAEDWDGLPDRREQLLQTLTAIPNMVVLSGDIHAFFAGTPQTEDGTKQIVEFVGGAASSGTYQTLLTRQAAADPTLNAAGGPALAGLVGLLLLGQMKGSAALNPNLGYADLQQHGAMLVNASAATLGVTFVQTPEETASARLDDSKLAAAFTQVEFKVDAGKPDLFQKIGSDWKRWDPKTFKWV